MALLAIIFFLPSPGQTAGADSILAFQQELTTRIESENDPDMMMALVALYTGLSWKETALTLAGLSPGPQELEFLKKLEPDYPKQFNSRKISSVEKQIIGLTLLYRSVGAVAGVLAIQQENRLALAQLVALERKLAKSLTKSEGEMRSVVSLTKGIMTMLALCFRSLDNGHQFLSKVNQELNKRVEKAELIRVRTDIYNYARLFLWAENNIEGCFELVILLNEAVDSKLRAKVRPIHQAWLNHSKKNPQPSQALILSMTALAEASFPLLVLLASR